MPEPQTILIVDDEKDFSRGLCRLLGQRFPACRCIDADSGTRALSILENRRISLMLTDLRMPSMTGDELLTRVLAIDPNLSVVIMTAFGDVQTAVKTLKSGAYDFLLKPLDNEVFFRVVERGLERNRLLCENVELKSLTKSRPLSPSLIGQSRVMARLRETIATVAQTNYTVLIRGESGVGKELVARMIHRLSPRAKRPMVTVNCPAIPSELLESELFGHTKGAYTGADASSKGLFLSADNSTLLLDEIGDIDPTIQTKLLRAIQEREIRPVGSTTPTKVDVRILASTNQDLEHKIHDGAFREDLFYRLNVLTIDVPPLRERSQDIPLLVQFFILRTCREMSIEEKEIDPDVLSYLATKTWPGNVRELINFIRRLVLFSRGKRITMSSVSLVEGTGNLPTDHPTGITPYKQAKADVLNQFTRTYVTDLLEKTSGNISEAARQSGLGRVSLQKILRRMDISARDFRK
ncbi:sigma-54-dependent transcriptional regulator [Desulfoplanes formicivorans]|uniref:Fis family transcriptional regulator n=1 Tax=Desulfoplanes formicivorans TaxID=1592317 RepID=A0A194AF09_9BACT|nr:sigma-54 dependent transcriptional regulator [Desulfoplanes formicivorans]GAU07918.1 Fis family transcriptional regulator [Desulfoplanes formicivorans]